MLIFGEYRQFHYLVCIVIMSEKLRASDIIDNYSRDIDIKSEELLAVQLIPHSIIRSTKQLLKGIVDAIEAFINKENIARRLSLEMLLRALGIRQISQALSKVKVNGAKYYWLIAISRSKIPSDLQKLCIKKKSIVIALNAQASSAESEYQAKVRAEPVEVIIEKELLEMLSIPFTE